MVQQKKEERRKKREREIAKARKGGRRKKGGAVAKAENKDFSGSSRKVRLPGVVVCYIGIESLSREGCFWVFQFHIEQQTVDCRAAEREWNDGCGASRLSVCDSSCNRVY